eukprot:4759786-Pyramimonas_sp.AAC.1
MVTAQLSLYLVLLLAGIITLTTPMRTVGFMPMSILRSSPRAASKDCCGDAFGMGVYGRLLNRAKRPVPKHCARGGIR